MPTVPVARRRHRLARAEAARTLEEHDLDSLGRVPWWPEEREAGLNLPDDGYDWPGHLAKVQEAAERFR